MRAISFMLTEPQIVARTKTVTRRVGWWKLKIGEQLRGVRKAMGLKKGQKQHQLCVIEVVSVRMERLRSITAAEVIAEGFPSMTPAEFVEMFCKSHSGCTPDTTINRIEFKYL